jgi:hypothetical protein
MGNTDRRRKCACRRIALYNAKGVLIGGLGVSGDPTRPDNIAYDTVPQTESVIGVTPSGWGHATCSAAATTYRRRCL